jgi:kumamolisin
MTNAADETPTAGAGRAGRAPLPGSARPPAAGAQAAAAPHGAAARIEATLVLRRRAELPESALRGAPLSRDELAERYGADPADVQRVTAALAAQGIEVLSVDAASRRLRVAGTVEALQGAFGTSLEWAESEAPSGGRVAHWHRTGELSLPDELAGTVTAVLGLDSRPQARANFRAVLPHAVASSYTPVQLGGIYGFPSGTDGSGRTVAIIELGGGYEASDLETYFSGLGVGSPKVTAWASTAPRTSPAKTRAAPTARSRSTSRWSAVWRRPRRSSSTSRPTPTPASSTPSRRRRTRRRPPTRSASAGARAKTSGRRRRARRWTTPSPTRSHSA